MRVARQRLLTWPRYESDELFAAAVALRTLLMGRTWRRCEAGSTQDIVQCDLKACLTTTQRGYPLRLSRLYRPRLLVKASLWVETLRTTWHVASPTPLLAF
jgi:hypothetical protein